MNYADNPLLVTDSLRRVAHWRGTTPHFLCTNAPLDKTRLFQHRVWICAIEEYVNSSTIGVLIVLASTYGRQLVLQNSRVLSTESWRQLLRPRSS